MEIADPAAIPRALFDELLTLGVPYDVLIADAGLLGDESTPHRAGRARPRRHRSIDADRPFTLRELMAGADRFLAPCDHAQAFVARWFPDGAAARVQRVYSHAGPAPEPDLRPSDGSRHRLGIIPIESGLHEQQFIRDLAAGFRTTCRGHAIVVMGDTPDGLALIQIGNTLVTGSTGVGELADACRAHGVGALLPCATRPLFGHPPPVVRTVRRPAYRILRLVGRRASAPDMATFCSIRSAPTGESGCGTCCVAGSPLTCRWQATIAVRGRQNEACTTSFVWSEERILSGFVVDLADPAQRFVVELLIDGLSVKTRRADEYAFELAQQNIGDGCYGFSFFLRDEFVSEGSVAEARLANIGTLIGSPITFGAPDQGTNGSPPGEFRWLGGLRFSGWLARNAHEQLDVLVDGELVAQTETSGWCNVGTDPESARAARAFSIALPERFADGRARQLSVMRHNGDVLPGCPIAFVAFADGLARALARIDALGSERLHAEEFDRLVHMSLPFSKYEDWRERFPPAAGGTRGRVRRNRHGG